MSLKDYTTLTKWGEMLGRENEERERKGGGNPYTYKTVPWKNNEKKIKKRTKNNRLQ